MAADAKAKPATKKRTKSSANKKKAAAADSPFRNFTPYKPKRNEEYMSEGQLAHLRGMLAAWRNDLMEEVDRTVNHMQDTCGIEIGLRRLEARPTATQCVDCKALDEIKERQLHG